MKTKLTNKQSAFIDEYMIDLNSTQAAIRAGYSKKTADRMGPENMCKPVIQAELEKRLSARSERTTIDSDYVLSRLSEVDQMDVIDILNDDGTTKAIKEWPKIWRQFISGIDITEIFTGSGEDKSLSGLVKKIKWPDKLKNLELIGKHVNVRAFRENVELTGNIEHHKELTSEELNDKLKELGVVL